MGKDVNIPAKSARVFQSPHSWGGNEAGYLLDVSRFQDVMVQQGRHPGKPIGDLEKAET